MGIDRKDKIGRMMAMGRNFDFFGAPVGIIFTVHERMEKPQWSDIGMFIQTVMLLAREYGLHTCSQEAWGQWPDSVSEVCGIPKSEIVFAGLAIGKARPDMPVNHLKTSRVSLEEVATFIGFTPRVARL